MAAEHFQKGQTVFCEGDKSQDAYFIVQGSVEISISTAHGPQSLAVLGSNEIFGEMGMIMDRPRSATATALENTLVERIGESEFESYFLQNPERLHTYLATLFERIRRTDLLLQQVEGGAPAAAVAKAEKPSSAADYRVRLMSCHEAAEPSHPAIEREVRKFPFRIGRSYFDTGVAALARNDLSIEDHSPYQLSRNHCEITFENGRFLLRDRGSKLGTQVGSVHVSVDSGLLAVELPVGETSLTFGSASSPHHYRLHIERV